MKKILEIDGEQREIEFSDETVEKIFMPFLHELTALKMTLDRKVVAYLVGCPGVGKTSTAKFLEQLSRERSNEVEEIRALGIDGFQFTAAYMNVTEIERDGQKILMRDVLGAPETFDVDLLVEKIREARHDGTNWNVYDRKIGDVLPDFWTVEDDILLIEGNYLLLNEEPWTRVRVLCDYSVFLMTNFSEDVERVMRNCGQADETWKL